MSSMGSLELLKETALSNKQSEIVDTIISSNSVLLLLIEDILQLVKIEFENKEGVKKSNDQPICLFECLNALKNIVNGYASQFSVNLNFFIDEAIPGLYVESNRSRLHQILSNLLTNAVKASKKDSTVELHCKVTYSDDNSKTIQFKVLDMGCGIPKSKLEVIFEPFIQLNSNNESKVPRYVHNYCLETKLLVLD